MSSEIKKRKFQGPEEPIEEKFNVKTIIIPFYLMPGRKKEYIYTGGEKIPFSERHPVYRELFLSEFALNIER
ncbi:hypothetical protein LCGC14_1998880 [marine sediment metagenome]|uniref:Uncharacterized protein n=1 Tax=marine sediment metagenome TaxID=412755 RepID=A0A0F9F3N0_9ZZZZ